MHRLYRGYTKIYRTFILLDNLRKRKSRISHQAIRRKEKKKSKPEEHEGMPQHCPSTKYRGDRNPKYHEEQQKDVA
jgi:hypothetical protein